VFSEQQNVQKALGSHWGSLQRLPMYPLASGEGSLLSLPNNPTALSALQAIAFGPLAKTTLPLLLWTNHTLEPTVILLHAGRMLILLAKQQRKCT